MKVLIEIDEGTARAFREIAEKKGERLAVDEQAAAWIRELADMAATKPAPSTSETIRTVAKELRQQVRPCISSDPGVMGGDAVVGTSRVPVWVLVSYKKEGMDDSAILEQFPALTRIDLQSAWEYYTRFSGEIDRQRRAHEEAV